MNPIFGRIAASTVCALAALTFVASPAHAGSIEYLSNLSADYIRTFSRNAATDGADVALYNPAGTTWLKDGIYVQLNNQTLIGKYNISYDGKDYPSDIMVPALPSLIGAFKMGDLAVFGAFSVPSGGGSLEYKEGVPFLQPLKLIVGSSDDPENGYFKGSSIFYGGTLGVAYKFKDMISVSLGARYVMVKKQYEGGADYGSTRAELNASKEAAGLGFIAGLAVQPGFGLTLGLRYETQTDLEFEATTTSKGLGSEDSWKTNALSSFRNGAKEQRPMPAVLGGGLAWSAMGLTVSASFHYYMTEAADAAKDEAGDPNTGIGAYIKSWDDDYENGWDLGVSAEYQLTEELLVSVGYIKAKIGGNEKTYSDFEYAMDSNSVGGGVRYGLTDSLNVTVAISRTFYDDVQNKELGPKILYAEPETFSKSITDIALGLQYRL